MKSARKAGEAGTMRLYIRRGGRESAWYGALSDWGPFAEYQATKIKKPPTKYSRLNIKFCKKLFS
jgi:hypothetical protein